MKPYLEMKDVSFSYRNQNVLNTVSLDIYPQDYMAIIGHNGSGKSTLLKLLLGLLEPESGEIYRFGELNYEWKPEDIGYIPQSGLSRLLSFPATVIEVLLMQFPKSSYFSFYNKKNRIKALEVLETVGLKDLAHKTLSNLSGGQLQRVLIAKELMKNPKILLLDEPTNGLDQQSVHDLYHLLNNLNQTGVTILMVTHHLDDLNHKVNRIIEVDYQKLKEVK